MGGGQHQPLAVCTGIQGLAYVCPGLSKGRLVVWGVWKETGSNSNSTSCGFSEADCNIVFSCFFCLVGVGKPRTSVKSNDKNLKDLLPGLWRF